MSEFNKKRQCLAEGYMDGRWLSQDRQFDVLIPKAMIIYHILLVNFYFSFFVLEQS